MSFSAPFFEQFKRNLATCYQGNIQQETDRDARTIVFNTRVKGMKLLFSTNEVGSLLALMQEASLGLMLINADNEILDQ